MALTFRVRFARCHTQPPTVIKLPLSGEWEFISCCQRVIVFRTQRILSHTLSYTEGHVLHDSPTGSLRRVDAALTASLINPGPTPSADLCWDC